MWTTNGRGRQSAYSAVHQNRLCTILQWAKIKKRFSAVRKMFIPCVHRPQLQQKLHRYGMRLMAHDLSLPQIIPTSAVDSDCRQPSSFMWWMYVKTTWPRVNISLSFIYFWKAQENDHDYWFTEKAICIPLPARFWSLGMSIHIFLISCWPFL